MDAVCVDSEALLTFLAVHRAGGFSNAATALRRSQPAISRRIALLEAELGFPLFERIPGGGVLSPAGEVLLPFAERVAAELHDAGGALAELRRAAAGPVALAAVGTLAGTNLTRILKQFAARHPGVELSLRTATSAGVSEAVRRGEAAIGLRYLLDPSPDLHGEIIAAESLTVACRPDHPLAERPLRTLADLHQEHWLAFPGAFDQRETFADNIFAQFQARGIGSIRWSPVDSLTAQKRLVEAGFGLALLPESALQDELRAGTLATLRIRDLRASNPVVVVTRKKGYLSPAARSLLDLLRRSPTAAGGKQKGKRARTARATPRRNR